MTSFRAHRRNGDLGALSVDEFLANALHEVHMRTI